MSTTESVSRINLWCMLTMNHLSTDTFHPSVFCCTSALRVCVLTAGSEISIWIWECKGAIGAENLWCSDTQRWYSCTVIWKDMKKRLPEIVINTMWLAILDTNRIVPSCQNQSTLTVKDKDRNNWPRCIWVVGGSTSICQHHLLLNFLCWIEKVEGVKCLSRWMEPKSDTK